MDRNPRRFNMGDMMIVVAVVALGAAGTRSVWHLMSLSIAFRTFTIFSSRFVLPNLLLVWLLPLTVGFVAARLRRPRPRRPRLVLQPGMSAACAVGIVGVYQALAVGLKLAWHGYIGLLPGTMDSRTMYIRSAGITLHSAEFAPDVWFSPPWDVWVCANLVFPCGLAVAVVWIILWVAGLWRGEKSWIDRLGRVLGALWIAISVTASIPF